MGWPQKQQFLALFLLGLAPSPWVWSEEVINLGDPSLEALNFQAPSEAEKRETQRGEFELKKEVVLARLFARVPNEIELSQSAHKELDQLIGTHPNVAHPFLDLGQFIIPDLIIAEYGERRTQWSINRREWLAIQHSVSQVLLDFKRHLKSSQTRFEDGAATLIGSAQRATAVSIALKDGRLAKFLVKEADESEKSRKHFPSTELLRVVHREIMGRERGLEIAEHSLRIIGAIDVDPKRFQTLRGDINDFDESLPGDERAALMQEISLPFDFVESMLIQGINLSEFQELEETYDNYLKLLEASLDVGHVHISAPFFSLRTKASERHLRQLTPEFKKVLGALALDMTRMELSQVSAERIAEELKMLLDSQGFADSLWSRSSSALSIEEKMSFVRDRYQEEVLERLGRSSSSYTNHLREHPARAITPRPFGSASSRIAH